MAALNAVLPVWANLWLKLIGLVPALFCIRQMNPVNSRNGRAMMTAA